MRGKKPLLWYISRHRELWDWLAENPEKDKRDWPKWKKFNREYTGFCFLCQYTLDYHRAVICEIVCPVIWRLTKSNKDKHYLEPLHCNMQGSVFNEWEKAIFNNDLSLRKYLACQIRDLPLKPYAKEELKIKSK